MTRRDLTLPSLSSAFLGIAAFRMLTPAFPSTRRVSVEGVEIGSPGLSGGARALIHFHPVTWR